MDVLIQERRVDQPMNAEEVHFMDRRHEEDQDGKPKPVVRPIDPAKDVIAVAIAPEQENFDSGPCLKGLYMILLHYL